MRAITIALLPLAFSASVLPASAATVVWQGEAVVTSATAACSAANPYRNRIGVGSILTSVLRPALIGDNGNDSRVSFVNNAHSIFALDLAGGLNLSGTGTYAAYGVTDYDGTTTAAPIKTNVGGQYQAFTLSPASPTATTTFLKLNGTISNFMFISGCKVTFRAGYSLRPV